MLMFSTFNFVVLIVLAQGRQKGFLRPNYENDLKSPSEQDFSKPFGKHIPYGNSFSSEHSRQFSSEQDFSGEFKNFIQHGFGHQRPGQNNFPRRQSEENYNGFGFPNQNRFPGQNNPMLPNEHNRPDYDQFPKDQSHVGAYAHSFPGHHGFPGKPGHHLPPFFGNVTKEALKELKEILANRNLTKSELETQMKEWATKQGQDVSQKMEKMLERRRRNGEKMKQKLDEILETIKTTLGKIEAIKSNMQITKMEEKKQLSLLHFEVPMHINHIIKMLTNMAKIESIRGEDVTTNMPTFEVPNVPTVAAP